MHFFKQKTQMLTNYASLDNLIYIQLYSSAMTAI